MTNLPTISAATYEELREKTLFPHETASLFESVAEISSTTDEEDEDFIDEDGDSVNAFASPLSLWEMKTGRYKTTPPNRRSLWSRIKWGVLNSACADNNLESRRPEGTYIDAQIQLLSARPDYEVSDDGVHWYPMIAKNIASTMADTWRNGVGQKTPPEHMIIEANHYMAVTGADRFYIAALFGGVTEEFFVLHRDQELVEDILGAAESFWKCVKEDRRPKSSGARDAAVLGRINTHIDPEDRVIDMRNNSDFLAALEEKDDLSKQKSKLEKRIKEINALLTEQLIGSASAIISDEKQLKWVHMKESEVSFTRKASSHLRASKITEKSAGTPVKELVE